MTFDDCAGAMNGNTPDHFVDANKLVEWLNAVRQDWHDDWDFQKVYAVDYILMHIEEMRRERTSCWRQQNEGGSDEV